MGRRAATCLQDRTAQELVPPAVRRWRFDRYSPPGAENRGVTLREEIRSCRAAGAECLLQRKMRPMSDARSGQPSEQTKAIEQVIFKRELNEVYLLLDFISGRADRSLVDLKPLPGPGADDASPLLSPSAVVSVVCQLRYPPTGSAVVNANEAAFLLRVKDALNRLAYPAGGFSIAFTSLFIGQRRNEKARAEYSRLYFAREAYPALEGSARRLRHLLFWLSLCAGLIAVLTAWTSWHVAMGQALLHRLDEVKSQATLQAAAAGNSPAAAVATAPDAGNPGAAPAQSRIGRPLQLAYRDVGDYKRSGSFRFLEAMLDPGRQASISPMATSSEQTTGEGTRQPATQDSPGSEQAVGVVLAVYTNYVLPMLFGLLGTVAAAVRDIQGKVSNSTLSPSDYALSLVRLPLGVMAGLAVGLFFTPSSQVAIPQVIGLGNAAAITLTAAGLAFLAGYGSEAFFSMLDQLIGLKFRVIDQNKPISRHDT
jgi:hypothetical protein